METNKQPRTIKRPRKAMSPNVLLGVLMSICMVSLVLGFIVSKKLVEDIRFNNKIIVAKNKVNATLASNVEALPKLQENFKNLQQDGPQPQAILQALPTTADYANLAASFEATALSNGTRLLSIAQETAVITDSGSVPAAGVVALPQEVRLRATAGGTYAQLQALIKALEKLSRPIKITQVTLSGSEPSVVAEIAFTTYFQPVTTVGDVTETIQ